jgi:transposase
LAAGELDAVWTPDERCRVMRRRLSRREQLVRSRSRAKNEIHAVLMRRLKGKPPMSDLFSAKGRQWLRSLELPLEESETLAGCMRHVEFLDAEIEAVERLIASEALDSAEIRRLMTVPGVNVICAATFMAAVGDIRDAELQLARQAESSYARMVRDWQAATPAAKVGASVTLGRASQKPSKGKVARQTTSP